MNHGKEANQGASQYFKVTRFFKSIKVLRTLRSLRVLRMIRVFDTLMDLSKTIIRSIYSMVGVLQYVQEGQFSTHGFKELDCHSETHCTAHDD